jgi:hypothetical protein
LKEYPVSITLIHGNCRGADKLSGEVAEELGFNVEVFNAQWHIYGRAAGIIRNKAMIEKGKPDMVYAFHEDLNGSKGTKDTVRRARERQIPVRVIV